MTKRFMSLLLALILLLSAFSLMSCQDDANASNLNPQEDRLHMTVDLWIPCYPGTTEESMSLVADALNEICEAKYTTHIEFHFIPSDSYEEVIDQHLFDVEQAKIEADEEDQLETTDEAETTEEATILDDYGVPVFVYPSVLPTQMDIFLVRGYDTYSYYSDAGLLSDLDFSLTEGDAKRLRTYIYPSFLNGAEIDDILYGIPNNTLIGESTVLLINKSALNTLAAAGISVDPNTISSPYDCKDIISAVASRIPSLTPVAGEFSYAGLKLWNNGDPSSSLYLLASEIEPENKQGDMMSVKNIFDCDKYTQTLYMNKWIAENGYVGNGSMEKGKFAVATFTGTVDEIMAYEDEYYICVLESPTATREAICENVFVVSSYTRNLTRSVEVLTLLNTNEDFRTILQYGVEGVHWKYTYDTKSTITRLAETYNMKLVETGNAYLTYPGYGQTKDLWELWKTNNLSSVVSPFFDFNMDSTKILDYIQDSIANLNRNLTTRKNNVANLEKEIAEFKGTEDELKALQNSLESAKRSVKNTENSIAEAQVIMAMLKTLDSESLKFYNRIKNMSSSQLMSNLDTLRRESNFLKVMRYSLSVETFIDYEVTQDTNIIDSKPYYYVVNNTYQQRRNLIIGTPVSSYSDTLYDQVEKDCSYSLNNLLYEYCTGGY